MTRRSRAQRPIRIRRVAGWAAGVAVGAVVGVLLATTTQDWQEEREARDVERRAEVFGRTDEVPAPGDAVRSLLAQDSLVAIDPLLADRLPEDDVRRAEAILAESPVPARIAYLTYPDTTDDGYTTSGAAAQWSTGVGEEGHYVVLWDNGNRESVAVGLETHYVETRTDGQPGPALIRVAAEMAAWEAEALPTAPAEPNDSDYWGGVGGGIAAAGLFGTFIVLPLFALLRWYVGSRRRKVS
ncbi:hypothetical protein F4692_000410 [Nocardioides cavernae]|uniref:Uncharacterized protein n=1 Tax=Nocardioides cavernae TaxID=1921566 RepID=A0A7Y9KN42_9ACTN|nr:hypothetical protein [Nocardioides cavernae]NYE35306.1 hypothetical protein [Nocardioides cavernae]